MKSAMYISAEQIQVIGYSGENVSGYAEFSLPEGTMYNGTIMDSAFLVECLVTLKKDNPKLLKGGVSLVADGSSILSRKIATPTLSNKQILQLVRDDFVDSIGDTNDLVCGYHKLNKGSILGCAVNKSLVDSYLAVFKEAGIKLISINMGVELLTMLVESRPELQKSTIVLNVVDGPTMLSVLFVKGQNIFMSRTRIFGDERETLLRNILDNLSGLIQFTQSQNQEEITASYYLGVSVGDIAQLEEFNQYDGIRINGMKLYKGGTSIPPQVHFACLAMKFGSKAINLVAARAGLDKYIKSKKPKKWWIPALVLYVLVLGGIAGSQFYFLNEINSDIAEVEAYINAPHVVERQEEIQSIVSETAFYTYVTQQVDARAEWELTMPTAARTMVDFILFGHGLNVVVNSFDFNETTRVVRVSATTVDARTSADFVDVLNQNDMIRSVLYQGYGSTADGEFNFTIDITLYVTETEDEDEYEEEAE